MNRDVLYHGTRYGKLILRTGVLLRAEIGEQKVCLTRSPEVAAYWALSERDDDEKGGAILVLDRQSLERKYKVRAVPWPFWHTDEVFHDEAEEEIWHDVTDIDMHLIGFVTQIDKGPRKYWPHRPRCHMRYVKDIESRILKLSVKRQTRLKILGIPGGK